VLNEAKKNIANIDTLQEDPENFIYSYFEETVGSEDRGNKIKNGWLF